MTPAEEIRTQPAVYAWCTRCRDLTAHDRAPGDDSFGTCRWCGTTREAS